MVRTLIAVFLAVSFIAAVGSSAGQEFRSLTGENNNKVPGQTQWGVAGVNLLRVTDAHYADGTSALRSGPNPRVVSNIVFDQPTAIPDENGLSQYSWAWGQFLAHDTDLTPLQSGDGAEHIDIQVPPGDPVFQPGQVISVTRSVFDGSTGSGGVPREHPNVISAYIDAGMVYGGASDEPNRGQDRADWLRDPARPAKLKVTPHVTGDLLPQKGVDPSAPGMAMDHVMGPDTFIAGDRRANEHAVLTTMHTLMLREHNRIADILLGRSDIAALAATALLDVNDYVYERARKIVGGEIQAITYNEYLPTLGINLPTYGGYDDGDDPTISPEFAVAAFRLGHTQVAEIVPRLDATGATIPQGDLDLTMAFFDPSRLTDEGGIDPILRGLAVSPQEATDAKMRNGLRNLLFGPPIPGPIANGSDLAALNTIRGRDHGLPTYQQAWTELLGAGTAPQDFADITSDPSLQSALAAAYTTVDKVDLWVGLLSEDHAIGKSIGTLTEYLLAYQFLRLRDCDRFYIDNDPDLLAWNTFDPNLSDLEWLQSLRLSDVIRANTGVASIQSNVFLVPEPAAMTMLLLLLALAACWRRSTVHGFCDRPDS